MVMLDRADYWQCGFVIPKGAAEDIKKAGLDEFRKMIADLAPFSDAQLVEVGIKAGERVIDLGCGPGGVLHLLGKRVGPSGYVLGLDRSSHFVELARHPDVIKAYLGEEMDLA